MLEISLASPSLKILVSTLVCPSCTLGFPSVLYQEIIDKVEKQLSGWNVSHLSMTGISILVQSVIQVIHTYAMQTSNLPSRIKARIDQACKKFIWSGAVNKQKVSLIFWNRICQQKIYGGLGFKNLVKINKALVMKVEWNLISKLTSFWSQVLLTNTV